MTWLNGRRLTSITTGGKTTTYAYDADGIRTTKVVGGVTHEYLTLNGKVVYEKIGTGDTAKIMAFTYDAQGRPFAVKYSKNNGESFTNYFYALNLQGDVVKIFRPNAVKDADGTTIGYTERTYATYSYNAWGELTGITDSNGNSILNKQTTSTALANLNPLRYRGYYYDNETGFYYLQSRYYDPANHRFINADIFTSTDSTNAIACNMFVYCGNNPPRYSDPSGMKYYGCEVGVRRAAVQPTDSDTEETIAELNAILRANGAREFSLDADIRAIERDNGTGRYTAYTEENYIYMRDSSYSFDTLLADVGAVLGVISIICCSPILTWVSAGISTASAVSAHTPKKETIPSGEMFRRYTIVIDYEYTWAGDVIHGTNTYEYLYDISPGGATVVYRIIDGIEERIV